MTTNASSRRSFLQAGVGADPGCCPRAAPEPGGDGQRPNQPGIHQLRRSRHGITALDVTKAYNLALTLERATDVEPGDTIKGVYTVTELSSGMTWTIEGTEPILRDDGMGGMIPDGISSDNWDYFGIRNTTPLESDGDDFDFLMDNFKLEIFGSTAATPGCDFDGDGTCDDVDINMLTAEAAAGTNDPSFDLNGDNVVDVNDVTDPDDGWLRLAGRENLGAGLSFGLIAAWESSNEGKSSELRFDGVHVARITRRHRHHRCARFTIVAGR